MDIFNVFVDMQATGTRIKELRKQSNMRVCELAEALGLESEQAIYKWQRGQCLPNVDNLVRLSIIFGCHIEDILMNNMEMEEDASPLLSFLGFGVFSGLFSTISLMIFIIFNPTIIDIDFWDKAYVGNGWNGCFSL